MKIRLFLVEKSSLTAQKIYFTSDLYEKFGYGTIVRVDIGKKCEILGRACLYGDLHVKNTIFLDKTIASHVDNWTSLDLNHLETLPPYVTINNITKVTSVKECAKIDVRVVYENPQLVKWSGEEVLVKNILQQFVVSKGSIVFDPLPKSGIYCIIVENINRSDCEAARVTKKTAVSIHSAMSESKFCNQLMSQERLEFDRLFIPESDSISEKVKTFSKISQIVEEIVNPPPMNGIQPTNKILVVGTTGSGKTSLITAISRKSERILLTLKCGDVGLQLFTSELSKIIEKAKDHAAVGEKCIVLLKNLDRVGKTDRSNKNRIIFTQAALMLEEICDNNVSLIATTDSPENVHSIFKKVGCFGQEVELPMLTQDDRRKAFRMLCRIYGVECADELARKVAKWTPGYVLSDLLAVIREGMSSKQKPKKFSEGVIKKAIANTSATCMRGTQGLISSRKTFADIGGLVEIKKELTMSVVWPMEHPDAFARLGIEPTKGILLYGPPGCAKTTLVKALAFECSATFIAVSAADLYSPYVGESEKRVAKLFMDARLGAPSIVFIDEIDALVGSKSGNRESGVQERILATLLMEMDGVGVNITVSDSLTKENEHSEGSVSKDESKISDNTRIIVVGATNRPELLDDALKRPGRFDRLIEIPLPDERERLAILRKLTACMPIADNVNLKALAAKTEGFSGAFLKSLCAESALYALTARGMNEEEIVFDDFCAVIKKLKSDGRNIICNQDIK